MLALRAPLVHPALKAHKARKEQLALKDPRGTRVMWVRKVLREVSVHQAPKAHKVSRATRDRKAQKATREILDPKAPKATRGTREIPDSKALKDLVDQEVSRESVEMLAPKVRKAILVHRVRRGLKGLRATRETREILEAKVHKDPKGRLALLAPKALRG